MRRCSRVVIAFLIASLAAAAAASAAPFDRWFLDKTLRIDYQHTGTKGSETIALGTVAEEGAWPGSVTNLVDTLNLGEYIARAYDAATGTVIWSHGFSSLFNEWQTTDESLAGIVRTFGETVRMPCPRAKFQLTLSRRDKHMDFHEVFSATIDPNSPVEVRRERPAAHYRVLTLADNGSPHGKVDLLILGDGYRSEDMEKFRADARHFNDVMFGTEPFKSRRKDFNVRALEVPSAEAGIDKPDKNVWKRTAFGTAYNTFGSARYVLTTDNDALRDAAGTVPYDDILIIVNDDRYGGGGIYNLYATCFANTDSPGMEWQRDYVYVHEFGHSFAGLGDEYYTSQISYNDFYEKGVEPWEPNLTALTDKANLKWRSFVEKGTPVPTPWQKAIFDSLGRERMKLDRLAPDYYAKRKPTYDAEQRLLKESEYAGKVGAFEGAGYVSQGIYRPAVDCRMFSLSLVGFDPVCTAAINRVIDFYTH